MRALAERKKSIGLGPHRKSKAIGLTKERGIIRGAKLSIPAHRFARVIVHAQDVMRRPPMVQSSAHKVDA